MTTYGPFYPNAVASGWNNLDNVKIEDGNVATADETVMTMDFVGTDFRCGIHADKNILGIKLEIKAAAWGTGGGAAFGIDAVSLYKDGAYAGGQDGHYGGANQEYPLTWYAFTGPDDQWGLGSLLTPDFVNAADFGFVFCFWDSQGSGGTGQAKVDAMRMTVYTD